MNNISVDKKSKTVVVKVNTSLYPKKIIKDAAKAYSRCCFLNIKNGEITIKPKAGVDIDKIGYEFFNYMLYLMQTSE